MRLHFLFLFQTVARPEIFQGGSWDFFQEEAISDEAFFEVHIHSISSVARNSPRRLPHPPRYRYLLAEPYLAGDKERGIVEIFS